MGFADEGKSLKIEKQRHLSVRPFFERHVEKPSLASETNHLAQKST